MSKESNVQLRAIKRYYRHKRIRKVSFGIQERPRLCVYRSLNHLFAQLIDDSKQKVLFGISTLNKDIKSKIKSGGNVSAAKVLGEHAAVLVKKHGITKVCFDRGGYLYHGRVKAFADAIRESGIEF